MIAVPGFVDLQCNGGFGIDLRDQPERLWELAALLPRTGVTAWCPTIITSSPDIAQRALAALRERRVAGPVAEPIGLHLEGPFLSPDRLGIHDLDLTSPIDSGRAANWSRDSGVAIVTLAPELPGALDLIRSLTVRGVVVSIGHSNATAAAATAAIDAGATLVTHLFNAMSPLHHREPGVPGVALTDERLRVGVVADGLHLHPTVVDLAWRAVGGRLVLVTDAVAAMGCQPAGDGVRLVDGTLAGSDLTMDQAVRNLTRFTGCSLEHAAAAASTSPAAVLGIDGTADRVELSADGHVMATFIGGELAWKS